MITDAFDWVAGIATARAAAGNLLVGLDFDGTLAPIVPVPDAAVLPPHTRRALAALAHRSDTRVAVLSGRGLDDLRRRIDLPGLYYAGNHGLEIEGPRLRRLHDEAVAARQRLAETLALLREQLAGVPGVIVEDKELTASVHYRLVTDPAVVERVRAVVHRTCARVPTLRVSDGKRVVEIRPDVDWHKGRALGFLRQSLGAAGALPTIFIGDDRTDEDAFRELGDSGWSIIVGKPPRPDTAARGVLEGPDAVAEFLHRLAAAPAAPD